MKCRNAIGIKDFSDLLSPPPLGTNPINFELVKAGTAVKICVGGERFWCITKEVNGGIITARVNNQLVQVPWPLGMLIKFHRNCVYALDYFKQKTDEPYSQMGNIRRIPMNALP